MLLNPEPHSHAPAGDPSVTVAMSVHNDARFVAQAIASILDQTLGAFEFLIVNDGSSDGSAEIIDSFAAVDQRIHVTHQSNRGLIESLNGMIDAARAPLFARMDGDDIALPDRLARQAGFLAANPDCGVLGTHTLDVDAYGRSIGAGARRPLGHEAISIALESSSPICHPSVMMRTEILRDLMGYRPAYRHCEDLDLWLRASEVTRLCNLPESLLLYRRSPDQVSNRHSLEQHYGAAVAIECRKERLAGRADPSEGLATLPRLEELDNIFERFGVTSIVRRRLALGLLYSPDLLRGDAFEILMTHLRFGGARDGLWCTVLRLLANGRPVRSAKLDAMLAVRYDRADRVRTIQ